MIVCWDRLVHLGKKKEENKSELRKILRWQEGREGENLLDVLPNFVEIPQVGDL